MSSAPQRAYWLDGSIVSAEGAQPGALTHALHYGTSVFEGIRAYPTPRGVAVFRLDDHLRRLQVGAAHYGLELDYTLEQLHDACLETLRASGLEDAYLRPLVYFGDETIALQPRFRCSTHVLIAALPFPPLAGDAPGFRATISPVQKFSSRALPSTVKAGGHYTNSVLALQDAIGRGFDEAILLNERGDVAEGSGENIFIVEGGVLHTNDASADVLYGITRDSVLQIAADEGIRIEVGPISLDALLGADEAFFTGTAAEVIPILSVDDAPLPGRAAHHQAARRTVRAYGARRRREVRCRLAHLRRSARDRVNLLIVERGANRAHARGKADETGRIDRLRRVALGTIGLGMDLDDRAVQPGGCGRQYERLDQRPASGRVRRIQDDRQMRQLLEAQRAAEIAHVARLRVEAANAALAKHDVLVAFQKYVLGGTEQLVERRSRAALEQNRQTGARRRT